MGAFAEHDGQRLGELVDRGNELRCALRIRLAPLSDLFYVGPEAHALGDGSYRELRIGVHATAWRTGPLEWSAGLGYARSETSSSAYVRLGLLTRQ
ncbi:MAG: cellulose biosynthesis protein BcsS [Rhodoplanes sp.]